MNDYQYEFITTLQYRVKNLQAQVDAFKNGSKYLQMDAQYKSMLHTEECRIHKLEVELSNSIKMSRNYAALRRHRITR